MQKRNPRNRFWQSAALLAAALLIPCAALAQWGGGGQPAGFAPGPFQFPQAPAGAALQPNPPQPFAPIANGVVCPVASGLTSRIVTCIHDTVIWAVTAFLLPFSTLMGDTVSVTCALAVMLFGFNLTLGKTRRLRMGLMHEHITQDTIIFALKLGGVMVYTWNFGNFFPTLVSIMDWLVTSVTGYIVFSQSFSCPFSLDVWQRVDCGLNNIIGGLLPGTTIASGMMGFIVGCIFSGPVGFSVFMLGLMFFYTIILAIFRAMYIYLTALIAFCLLICMSPLIVPMILFRVTKNYFDRWLRLLFGLMLQPIFMFAYLSMLLAAMDIVVFSGPQSLFAMIAGNASQQPGFAVGQYLINNNVYVQRAQLPVSVNLDPSRLAQSMGMPGLENTGMWGQMDRWAQGLGSEYNTMVTRNIGATINVPAISMQQLASVYYGVPVRCDPSPPAAQGPINCPLMTNYIIQVCMSLLTAGVMAYIFYVMLQTVPYLAAALSGTGHPGSMIASMAQEKMGKGLEGLGKQLQTRS